MTSTYSTAGTLESGTPAKDPTREWWRGMNRREVAAYIWEARRRYRLDRGEHQMRYFDQTYRAYRRAGLPPDRSALETVKSLDIV